jgi:hypothetical protein
MTSSPSSGFFRNNFTAAVRVYRRTLSGSSRKLSAKESISFSESIIFSAYSPIIQTTEALASGS